MSTIKSQPETKNIKIQGGAEIFGGVVSSKKSTRSSRGKKTAQISKNPDNGTILTPIATPTAVTGVEIKKIHTPHTPEISKPSLQAQQSQPQSPTQSPTQPLKVILKKAEEKSKKVLLRPKKTHQEQKNQTRKLRKVTLGLHGLKKRLTKAQNIRKSLIDKPIDELRKDLITKGILKAGSKTPDALVRQIAGDAELVKANLL